MTVNLLVIAALLFASQQSTDRSRLRTTDARTAALVQLGLERSVTLRGLIAEVEAGDVIIHVARESFLPGHLTGRMKLIGRAGSRRYARIAIDAELPTRGAIASLAHELQHVSELIAHPTVEDEASMEHLFRRIGREYRVAGQMAFETDAARQIGAAVYREMSIAPDFQRRITITARTDRGAR
jgi:hypothetical protein